MLQYSPDEAFHAQQSLFSLGIGSRQFFTSLDKNLPDILDRKTASKAIGGLISPKTMSNDDARGVGPRDKIYVGRKCGYTKANFLEYLRKKIRSWDRV